MTKRSGEGSREPVVGPLSFVGILTIDPGGRILSANPAVEKVLGPAPGLIGRPLGSVEGLAAAGAVEVVGAARAAGAPRSLRAAEMGATDGSPSRYLNLDAIPVRAARDSDVVLVLDDVTAEVLEREHAAMFREAFLRSHDAMEITSRAGLYVDVNPAYERIYGYARSEVVGRRPNVLRSPKTPPEVFQRMWQALTDPARGRWSGELVNIDKSGREHPVLLTIDPIRTVGGEVTHYIGVATDLSEQRLYELEAIRTERLASVGQLAAGVAHELNTPLANIMLIAESLHRRAPNPWVGARAEAITGQVDSAAKIVAGLLDFARVHPADVRTVDLVEVAEEAVGFLQGKQSPDLEVRQAHATRPLQVRGNRVQLLQVCVNLLTNAHDAMAGRGRLTLRSRRTDEWAELAVEDTGPGIPPEVLAHIFEPFFTTKPVGKGTGLGLSICHGIVRAHGGEITVATEIGRGSTFTVRLPARSD